MDANGTSIEARLEALEQKCRRLRVWCAAVTTALLIGCAAAALGPPDDVIRARAFEVLGDDGEVVAFLGSTSDRSTMLRIGRRGDDRAFAMIGVFPDDAAGSGTDRTGALFQLESPADSDPNIVAAHVSSAGAFSYLTNNFRTIESFIEPGRSCFRMSTEDEQDEPVRVSPPTPDDPDDDGSHPRFEIDLVRDSVEVRGRDRDGSVRFRQP